MSEIRMFGFQTFIVHTCKLIIDCFDGQHQSSSDLYRVGSVGDAIKSGLGDGTGQNGGGCGPVTRLLIGGTGNILSRDK